MLLLRCDAVEEGRRIACCTAAAASLHNMLLTCCAAVDSTQLRVSNCNRHWSQAHLPCTQLQVSTCNRHWSQAHLPCSSCQCAVAGIQALQLLPAHSCMAPCQLLTQLHQVLGHSPHLQVHSRQQLTEAGCQTRHSLSNCKWPLHKHRRFSLHCLDHLCCCRVDEAQPALLGSPMLPVGRQCAACIASDQPSC